MISPVHPFQKTLKGLDKLINQLELNLGLPHTPFSIVPESDKPIEEEVKIQETIVKKEQVIQNDRKLNEKSKNESKIILTKEEELKQLFCLLDIRVGRITECWKHPESEKLFCEKIDLGYEIREIASGVQKEIPIEKMSGLVLIAANLKMKKLGGFPSNGMVLMASSPDHSIIELLRPDPNTVIGERVFVDGLEDVTKEKAKELNPKHNILGKCLEVMKSDEENYVTFGGLKLRTSKGFIQTQTLKNASIS